MHREEVHNLLFMKEISFAVIIASFGPYITSWYLFKLIVVFVIYVLILEYLKQCGYLVTLSNHVRRYKGQPGGSLVKQTMTGVKSLKKKSMRKKRMERKIIMMKRKMSIHLYGNKERLHLINLYDCCKVVRNFAGHMHWQINGLRMVYEVISYFKFKNASFIVNYRRNMEL